MLVDDEKYLPEHEKMMHKAIKKVSNDIEEMKFNTAIATFMTMVNEFYKDKKLSKGEYKTFLQLLNPFAPHMTEELFEEIGESKTIAQTPWPTDDEAKTIDDEIENPIQINGKLKTTITISKDLAEDEIKRMVHENEVVCKNVENKTIVKEIYVNGKIYNIVVK